MNTPLESPYVSEPELRPTFVRLPRDLHEAIKQRAIADDRTMSQTIRVALRYYLAHAPTEHLRR
jgi:hypothetical protein